jgi:hypothetical protein
MITYDTPYNRKLVHTLRQLDAKAGDPYAPTRIPYMLNNYHGAKIGGGSHADQKYILPGNKAAFSPALANSGMVTQMRPRTGAGYSLTDFGNDMEKAAPYIMPVLEAVGAGESGGRLARAKSISRRVKRGREIKFEGLPEKPKRKGRLVKGSPEAILWGQKMRERLQAKKAANGGSLPPRKKRAKKGGNLLDDIKNAGSKAGDAFKSVTGVNPFDLGYQVGEKVVGPAIDKALGNKNAKMPNLGDVMEIAKPVLKEVGKKVLQKGADLVAKKLSGGSAAGGGRAKRAEIVKKVMKEKGFKKMCEASKYVKQHGLY